MNLAQSIRLALRGLSANKLRAGLTMLGIIIGVGAVIALLSAGEGAQAVITEQIQGIGSNLIFVIPGQITQVGGQGGPTVRRTTPLTLEDAEAMANPLSNPSVLAVAPEIDRNAEVTYAGESTFSLIVGTTPEYSFVRNAVPIVGDFITAQHVNGTSRVAVLGYQVAEALFPQGDAIDATIRINRVPFRVLGVLEEKGGGGFGGGGGQDNIVIIPISTGQLRLFGGRYATSRGTRVDAIYVSAVDENSVDSAIEEITQLLRDRHDIQFGEDDFTVASQTDILGVLGQITNVLTIFLGSIAGISLLVGGIGIMNIMLVSVTERTREIGIRKAVGAKRSDILSQFLVESIILSVLGGAIGIGLGAVIAAIINSLDAFTTVVSPNAVLLAVGFSVAVGLFFGIYPATRAARLNPIDALRYE